MIEDTIKDAENRMKKSIESLKQDLMTVRTGRANTALVDHLIVDYYGTPTPLNQIASVATPEARMITIQPWDKSAVQGIEKAILKSDLGLNPSNDGNVIRVPIPPLTEERRRDLVKLVHKRLEEGKIAIRNVRRDAIEHLRSQEKQKAISQDEQRKGQERLQKLTDTYVAQAEQHGSQKEAELLEI